MEILAWSNDSERNTVRSSKPQVGLPLARKLKTRTQAKRDQPPKTATMEQVDDYYDRSQRLIQTMKKATHDGHASRNCNRITDSPFVSWVHSACLILCAPQREVMKSSVWVISWQVQVFLKEIHVIRAFFISDSLSPPTKSCQRKLAKRNGDREWMTREGFGETGIF